MIRVKANFQVSYWHPNYFKARVKCLCYTGKRGNFEIQVCLVLKGVKKVCSAVQQIASKHFKDNNADNYAFVRNLLFPVILNSI